jgi:hypothetical protein
MVREMLKKTRQNTGDYAGEDAEEDAEQDVGGIETALEAPPTLRTLAEVEAFVRDPRNERLVSVAAVYLHLNRFKACRSPGTIGFLEDVQEMALFEEGWGNHWAPPSSHGLTFMDNGYCRAVPFHHPAFNARALLIALNFCYFERLKVIPANIDNCGGWNGTAELVRRRNEVLHELRATGRRALVAELINCRFRVENWFSHAPRPQGDAEIEDTGPIARPIPVVLARATGIVIGHPSPICFSLHNTAGAHLGSAAPSSPAIAPSASRVDQPRPLGPLQSTNEAEQLGTRQPRTDISAKGDGGGEQHSSNSTAQHRQHPDPTMPTVIDQSPWGATSRPSKALEADNAIDGGHAASSEPKLLAGADQPAARGEEEAAVEGGKGESTEAGKAKKGNKNKRRKDATKPRKREEQAGSAAVPASEPAPDGVNEVGLTTKTEVSNDPEAPDEPEIPDDAASELTMEDKAKNEEKEKRKAKQQRRKKRRRLEREAEAERKGLQEEAKAERQRQEEEQRKKELDKRFEEIQRHWEEERRRELIEEAGAVEAAEREQAEQARREEAARQLLEFSFQAKEAQETLSSEEAEARRDQGTCVAEETSRAEEARPGEGTYQAEETHGVEAAIPAEQPCLARMTEAPRGEAIRRDEAAQAHRAEQRDEAGSEQANEANLSQTTDVRRGKELEPQCAAENGVAKDNESGSDVVEESRNAEEAHGSEVRGGNKHPGVGKGGMRGTCHLSQARVPVANTTGNGAEEASCATGDGEAQDPEAELDGRQHEGPRGVDALERSSHQDSEISDAETIPAQTSGGHGNNCNEPLQQAPQSPEDIHGHQGNGAQRCRNVPSASRAQKAREGIPRLQAHEEACRELIEAAVRLGVVTPRAEEAQRRAKEAFQHAQDAYQRAREECSQVDEARNRVVEASQAVRALQALPMPQPQSPPQSPVPSMQDFQSPRSTQAPQTGAEPSPEAWVDDFIAQQSRTPDAWDPESRYNRVPRCLAHSRARSVDRGDFALPSWQGETRE